MVLVVLMAMLMAVLNLQLASMASTRLSATTEEKEQTTSKNNQTA